MLKQVWALIKASPLVRFFYPLCGTLVGIVTVMLVLIGEKAAAVTVLLIGLGIIGIIACRPGSKLHEFTLENSGWKGLVCILLVLLVTAFACVRPMGERDLWNGENAGHRNQYEKLAEAFLEGKLYIEYGDEDKLAALENPYDPAERTQAGVSYQWDHAFYKGNYYMYFGVVPVVTTFLPYRAITGESLTTYHATQLYAILIVAGLFVLFYLLAKRFFPRLSVAAFVVLAAAFSVMSVWFAAAEPALYCTAITAAVASMVWSLVCFVKAVYATKSENAAIIWAAVGALCGAATFGCRPTVGLANLLVIPLLIVFLRQRPFSLKLLGKLALAALPYVVVAAGLMWYNYVRFDSPFEFGQAYQLTVADQTAYGATFTGEELVRIYNETVKNFFGTANVSEKFPFLNHGGLFFNFPVLLLAALAFLPAVRRSLKEGHLCGLLITGAVALVAISLFQAMWTPYLLERYRSDLYFLAGLLCFVPLGIWCAGGEGKAHGRRNAFAIAAGTLTTVTAVLMCARQIAMYYPADVAQLEAMFFFWK